MARPGRLRNHDPIVHDIEQCIRLDQLDLARQLIGDSTDVLDGYARTPLIHAVINNSTEMLGWLIAAGANVNHQDRNGYSGLHFASQDCNVGVATMLLEGGCDPNLVDIHGNSALWTATHEASLRNRSDDHLEMVSLLLDSGANANLINKYGKCPKDIATRCEDPPLNSLFT